MNKPKLRLVAALVSIRKYCSLLLLAVLIGFALQMDSQYVTATQAPANLATLALPP